MRSPSLTKKKHVTRLNNSPTSSSSRSVAPCSARPTCARAELVAELVDVVVDAMSSELQRTGAEPVLDLVDARIGGLLQRVDLRADRRPCPVLRLVAEGLDTGEIARQLAFSERTIKSVLHDVTTRLQLRNRAHAVAFAVREGFI